MKLAYTQGDTVMQRTLLQGIERRAEGLARAQVEDDTPSPMAAIAVWSI